MKIRRNTNRCELLCRIAGLWVVMLLIFSGCAGSGRAVIIRASAGADETDPEETIAEISVREADLDELSQAETASVSVIFVHICGQVESPGVYELPENSRVWDGVQAAGGFLEDADSDAVNLAAPLSDGCKVTIPSVRDGESQDWYEENGSSGTAGSGQRDAAGGLIDINRASVSELTEIPGIGQVRAEAIAAYREAHGAFHTVEDIMNVTGIKEGLFEKMKGYITVGG